MTDIREHEPDAAGEVARVDFAAVTQLQQQVWSKGDFAHVAPIVQVVADRLVETVDVLPDERVLDVACGSGNAAIAAARAFADVTGVDFVPELLERGRIRAAAELLEVEFVEGDVQELPFEDGSFDVVLSTFGAMFAPDQERTAAELLRVTRPGGRIGMANWVPDGFVGEVFAATGRYVPSPPGIRPATAWGTEGRLRELLGDGIASLRVERRVSVQRLRSPEHFLAFFRRWFGPTIAAFERVEPSDESAFAAELIAVAERYNRAGERAAAITADYLEVVALRS
ncbi:MAG TPA: class I SAM-dependent methyltransferase [Gaiellaceae bacterium]|nr:class I SAM-dependent methyltransferase [Gaiellaceae bacterium]